MNPAASGGRAGAAGRRLPWPRSWDVCSTALTRSAPWLCSCLLTAFLRQVRDECVDLLGGERVAEVPRHHVRPRSRGRAPCSGRRSTPSRTPRDPRPPSSRRRRRCRGSGPIAPFVPAGVKAWQLPQPAEANTAAPGAAARPRRSAAPSPRRRSRPARRRCTGARIVAWPRPQSSVQMSVNVPVRVGVITMLVSIPGTTSCFCPIAGIQNEWITSADCELERDVAVERHHELVRLEVLRRPGTRSARRTAGRTP